MIKKLIKSTALLLLIILLPAVVLASGKMEVKLGNRVTLNATDVKAGSSYKWVVKKGREIVSAQANSIFNYTFATQGEYEINLTVTEASGKVLNTTILALAGDRYDRPSVTGKAGVSRPGPLAVSYTTLPPAMDDGRVHLLGDGKIFFTLNADRTDILEYRIDRNIFVDSDGDGVANNDIDNASDESYLKGGNWQAEYKIGESNKIVAEMTLVSRNGEKAKDQIEIVFDDLPRREGAPLAILELIPAPNPEDQLIHLYKDRETVAFYSRRSEGKIVQYRIDKNIFFDSDGVGNSANDIDNADDSSFTNGDVWETEYEKTDEQIIAQLIVVSEGGKGSRVQRGIWFTDKPKPTLSPELQEGIRLVADKGFVLKGDPITYTVEGLSFSVDNYSFAWDFDGDGEVDKEIEAENSVTHIYDTAEPHTVKVGVTDIDGNSSEYLLDIIVKEVIATFADFDFEVEGNIIRFNNLSSAALNLADKQLDYQWSFGDTDEESYEDQRNQIGLENPSYSYKKAGTYLVTLMVTDADSVVNSKSAEVVIEADVITGEEEEAIEAEISKEKAPSKESSLIVKIIKILLYLILIVIVLALLMLFGFMAFLKVQHPDLTLEELIDEFKIKLLVLLGVHEMIEEERDSVGAPVGAPVGEDSVEGVSDETMSDKQKREEKSVEDSESAETAEESAEKTEEKAPLAQETGPVPDWMNTSPEAKTEPIPEKEIIEGETIEEPIEGSTEGSVKSPIEKSDEEEVVSMPTDDEFTDLPEVEVEEDDDDEPPVPPSAENSEPPAQSGDESLNKQDGPVPDWLK